jgi:hypothetical protein
MSTEAAVAAGSGEEALVREAGRLLSSLLAS